MTSQHNVGVTKQIFKDVLTCVKARNGGPEMRFSRRRCSLSGSMNGVRSLGSTWEKERTDFYKLSPLPALCPSKNKYNVIKQFKARDAGGLDYR